jgi:hypothetical protein
MFTDAENFYDSILITIELHLSCFFRDKSKESELRK